MFWGLYILFDYFSDCKPVNLNIADLVSKLQTSYVILKEISFDICFEIYKTKKQI